MYYNSEWQNEVEIYYQDHHKHRKTFAHYRNYRDSGFTLPNFTFQPLLDSIKPKRILELVKYLLLEKKIILIRDNYADNAALIESLLMLLSPLYFQYGDNICSHWTFVNISYLSESMIDYIDAPMPYILGVPRTVWKEIKKQKGDSIPADVVIFDVDKNKLTCSENLPDLPPKAEESVYNSLLSIVDEKVRIVALYKNPAERQEQVN